jgi:hypothetical protein
MKRLDRSLPITKTIIIRQLFTVQHWCKSSLNSFYQLHRTVYSLPRYKAKTVVSASSQTRPPYCTSLINDNYTIASFQRVGNLIKLQALFSPFTNYSSRILNGQIWNFCHSWTFLFQIASFVCFAVGAFPQLHEGTIQRMQQGEAL